MSHPILSARIVQVVFGDHDNKSYAYYTTDESIAKDDLVLVVTPSNREGGISLSRPGMFPEAPQVHVGYPKVARVVSTKETVEGIEQVREWIVTKLDFAEYLTRRDAEEQRKLLNAKIKRAVEEAKRELDLTDLASRSPALAELLKQREALG